MKQTITKRYYSTSSAIRRPQIMKLLSEAIDDARKQVESGEAEEYYVVEIVRVIRKIPPKPAVNEVEVIEVMR